MWFFTVKCVDEGLTYPEDGVVYILRQHPGTGFNRVTKKDKYRGRFWLFRLSILIVPSLVSTNYSG